MDRSLTLKYTLAAVVLTIVTVLWVYDPTLFFHAPPTWAMYVLFVSVPAAMFLIWKWTEVSNTPTEQTILGFAPQAKRDEEITSGESPFRTAKRRKFTRTVKAIPSQLSFVLDEIAGGTPVAFIQIHPGIAYIAVTASDWETVSDSMTVLLLLEDPVQTFDLNPFIEEDPLPTRAIGFKDEEFTNVFVVEGDNPKAIRAFLSAELRDELLQNRDVHLHGESRCLALTFFGAFDLKRLEKLIELADLFFAEYGAEGGPELREAFPDETFVEASKLLSKPKKKAFKATAKKATAKKDTPGEKKATEKKAAEPVRKKAEPAKKAAPPQKDDEDEDDDLDADEPTDGKDAQAPKHTADERDEESDSESDTTAEK